MAYPDGEAPPVRGDNLRTILNPKYWTTELNRGGPTGTGWGWKDKYSDVTRGDLMRLVGWVPKDPQGKEIKEVSAVLESLDVEDMLTLSRILEDHNGMTYRGIYFCCSCA
jgi:hypothetical protein